MSPTSTLSNWPVLRTAASRFKPEPLCHRVFKLGLAVSIDLDAQSTSSAGTPRGRGRADTPTAEDVGWVVDAQGRAADAYKTSSRAPPAQ